MEEKATKTNITVMRITKGFKNTFTHGSRGEMGIPVSSELSKALLICSIFLSPLILPS